MNRKLAYTEDALVDLDNIRDWLTQPGSGARARRTLLAIRRSIRQLREYPCLYAVGERPCVREILCDGGYRALYRLSPDTGSNKTAGDVCILRVFGPGQDRIGL